MTSPDKAYYWIQANVLKADKMDLRESQGWLNRGYEGAAVGAALGAGITGYNSNSAGATLGVGLAAGLVGMAADAMVEDVNYTMITDVQIAERTKATVTTDNVAALRQGTSGAKIQTSTETGNQHKYQTRVVSNANKVNLKFEEGEACSRRPTGQINRKYSLNLVRRLILTGLLLTPRVARCPTPGCNKINFVTSRRSKINMKTLSGCANSLCDREVLPAKPGSFRRKSL